MRKAGILLSILLFSMLTVMLTIAPPVIAQTSDPKEMNSGMGRPYQDLTGVNASSDGTDLTVTVHLKEGPPKADEEKHVDIYVAIDTDNKTNSGTDWFPHHTNARYGPALAPDGPGGGHYYWEYCISLHRWTTPALLWRHLDGNTTAAGTVGATNSTDGKTVNITIPLASIGNPTNVTLGVVTCERVGTPPVGEPNPPTDFAHIFRDTIGNASMKLYTANWGQWLEVEPAIIGLLTSPGSLASASDAVGDFVILPCNDLTEVETGQGSLIVNVTMANMTYIWGKSYMFNTRWQVVIAVDTDGIPGSGQAWMPGTPGSGAGWKTGLADVRIDPAVSDTYWERAIVVDTPTGIHVYDTSFNDLGKGGVTATQVGPHKMKIEIPVGVLALAKPSRLNLTIVSGQDWYNLVNDVVGTWSYQYNSAVNTQGYYLVRTSIPPTEEIMPIFPGPAVPTPPSAIGRPYQDIRGASARSDGTNLYVNVTLDQGPPKRDNETHVNIYVAVDNGTTGGSWRFPDDIDAGYVTDTYWEYCLALYNWTTPGAQWVDLFTINEYVSPPGSPSLTRVDALARSVTVTNSTDGKIVQIKIPYTALQATKPSTVTLGIVTSEDLAKVKDTVGSGYVRLSFSQWVEITPPITGLSTAADSSSGLKPDPANDFVGKSFWDITGVTVEEEYNWILVNVTFQNVSTLSWSMNQWRLAIGIDTDHVAGSGQNWMAFFGYCDARIDESISDAYWERCVVLDSMVSIQLYDEAFTGLGASGIWAELLEDQNMVRVHMPNWNLPPSSDKSLNLTILSGMDGGNTAYDVYGTYSYAYSSENTQGFYNLTTTLVTGPVMYPYPLPGIPFNTAMGRPYQDITEVWAKADATNLNVSVTLAGGSPKQAEESNVNVYVAIDTTDGGHDWFPDNIDVRYNISEPEHFWEYCLAAYSWSGTLQDVDLINKTWARIDALSNTIGNVTVTNSTDGKTVNMTIPMALIGSPNTVTLGIVTSEDYSKVKDTVGSGTAIIIGWQWVEVEPAIIDLSTASSSASASDPVKDFCGKSFWDITDVNVNADYTDVIVDVTFSNVTGLSASWDHWWLAVEIDTDHVLGSGEPFTYAPGVGTDTRFYNKSVSEWEVCTVINSPTDVLFWNVTGTYPNETATWIDPPHGVTATLMEAENKVRVTIPQSWLKKHTWNSPYNLTITVVSGTDAGNRVYDIYGTYDYGYAGQYGVIQYDTNFFGFYVAYTDPSLNYTGPFSADLSLVNITAVGVNVDYWFAADPPSLKVAFYTYDGTSQANVTLPWTISGRVTKSTEVKHPDGKPIEIVKLLLDEGGAVSVIQKLVISRSELISRATDIDNAWPTASVAQRQAYMEELALIDLQWPYAPPTWP